VVEQKGAQSDMTAWDWGSGRIRDLKGSVISGESVGSVGSVGLDGCGRDLDWGQGIYQKSVDQVDYLWARHAVPLPEPRLTVFPISAPLAPITYHLSPITYHLSPITYHLSPITYHLSPITYHLSPITYHLSPIT
jgi:hypothetical protein